ncbi:MAG: sugar ABC transporter permease [Ruminococcaceae bacterium]|nr:sugar ABC transporter permease [Oscillospiraceae bacterium]
MNNTATKPATAPKKRKKAALDSKKARAGWFFVLPFIVGMIIIYLPIVVDSVKLSFHSIRPTATGIVTTFVGFENYSKALFDDPEFIKILTASLRQLVLDVPAIVIFALFMAIVLNQKMIGRAVFRAIFFVPVIISTGIIDSIDQSNSMASYMEGTIDTGSASTSAASDIINAMDVKKLLGNMIIGTELVDYVVGIVNGIFNIVNRSGVQLLVFLAGLQSINPSIYESCTMEGATPWETFWKITFPMISPMILVNAVYTVIDSFTSESNQVMSYIDHVYLEVANGRVISTAMSWIYFLLVVVLLGLVALLLSSFIFYQRRD